MPEAVMLQIHEKRQYGWTIKGFALASRVAKMRSGFQQKHFCDCDNDIPGMEPLFSDYGFKGNRLPAENKTVLLLLSVFSPLSTSTNPGIHIHVLKKL
jgi:hypothetical protein